MVYSGRKLMSVPVVVKVPPDQFDSLRERSRETGRTVSYLVREALESYLGNGWREPCGIAFSGGVVASGTLVLLRVG